MRTWKRSHGWVSEPVGLEPEKEIGRSWAPVQGYGEVVAEMFTYTLGVKHGSSTYQVI